MGSNNPLSNAVRNRICAAVMAALLVCSYPVIGHAQNNPELLRRKAKFLSSEYFQGDSVISRQQLERILLSSHDSEIVNLTHSERSYSSISFLPGFIGGLCVGYGVLSKPTNETFIISGVICAVGAFLIDKSSSSDLEQAIMRYNSRLGPGASYLPPYKASGAAFRVGITGSF